MTRKTRSRIQRDRTPKPVSVHQFFADRIRDVRKGFRVPVRVTVLVTHAEIPEGITVFGDDNFDQVIAALQVKRDEFIANQQSETLQRSATTEDARHE